MSERGYPYRPVRSWPWSRRCWAGLLPSLAVAVAVGVPLSVAGVPVWIVVLVNGSGSVVVGQVLSRINCGCPSCARSLKQRSVDGADALLVSWGRRHRLVADDDGQRWLVRVRPYHRPECSTPGGAGAERTWARSVLLVWAAWRPGVQEVGTWELTLLRAAGATADAGVEHCAAPVSADEAELLVRLAGRLELDAAASAAEVAVGRAAPLHEPPDQAPVER